MSDFTPGPWHVPHMARHDVKCDCGYVFGNDDRMGAVATVHWSDPNSEPFSDNPPRDEAEANARLIAAATDLYEACVAACNAKTRKEFIEAKVLAERALAKARGATECSE